MKCTKCGKEIANDSVFCEFCGKKVSNEETIVGDSGLSEDNSSLKPVNKPKGKTKKVIWFALATIILVAALVAIISMPKTPKVDFSGEAAGFDFVDLGLPSGTLWATCNIGAYYPEDYGYYFAWGETDTKTVFDWDGYKYANGDNKKLTKYCSKFEYGINGFTDNLTELQSSDDPAATNWDYGWHTPTDAQWIELLENTTSKWVAKGRLFTSKKNGRKLFLPAAGGRFDPEIHGFGDKTGLHNNGSHGYYRSSSLCTDWPDGACYLGFDAKDCNTYCFSGCYRESGFSVRPVLH